MALIKANPEAEISTGFEEVRPGTYRMRIDTVEDRNPQKNDLKIRLVHTTPATELCGLTGEPLKGQPSSLFDYIMLASDKQWKLRTLTEAAGLPWTDYDPIADLPGKEVDVVIKLEPYEGEQRNKVARYVVPK